MAKRLLYAGELSIRDEGDADLIRGDRGNVGLSVVTPVDLDEVLLNAAGIDRKVLAEADAPGTDGGGVEPGPATNQGLVPVRTYDEAGLDRVAVGVNDGASTSLPRLDALNHRLPA